ncbi:MAG: BlaI/MecI/CopY family transcriptional regulator [Oscillospiraceae bacterium]|nr:BlaI/MecI/CopY family transcriptional regulator [Oscillospiraceae bacterium]
MKDMHLGAAESRFADIIWEGEPLGSGELAKRAEEAIGWKRTTSYTVLKRLCERGIFENDGGTVRSLISREDFYAMQSEKVVEESFKGSLPAFVAAFTGRKKLTDKEIDELQSLIDSMRG